MVDKHSELEVKFKATKIKLSDFLQWGFDKGVNVKEYVRVNDGLDYYYSNSHGNVIRHRVGLGKNELTVKLRRSIESTADRLEIDLGFNPDTFPHDVTAFLFNTGWKLDFILSKDSYIFTINALTKMGNPFEYTAVIYDVRELDNDKQPLKNNKKRFLEIEIEKGSQIDPVEAQITLNNLAEEVQTKLKLKNPLNESLYEIYSGKKYLLQEK